MEAKPQSFNNSSEDEVKGDFDHLLMDDLQTQRLEGDKLCTYDRTNLLQGLVLATGQVDEAETLSPEVYANIVSPLTKEKRKKQETIQPETEKVTVAQNDAKKGIEDEKMPELVHMLSKAEAVGKLPASSIFNVPIKKKHNSSEIQKAIGEENKEFHTGKTIQELQDDYQSPSPTRSRQPSKGGNAVRPATISPTKRKYEFKFAENEGFENEEVELRGVKENLEEEQRARNRISMVMSKERQAGRSKPQRVPSAQAPGKDSIRPVQSAYLSVYRKNQEFSKYLRNQASTGSLARGRSSRLQLSKRQLEECQKVELKAEDLPTAEAPLSKKMKAVVGLGNRGTFSSEYKFRRVETVIHKQTGPVRVYKPDDFDIDFEDVLPGADEQFSHLRKLGLLKMDQEAGGNELEGFIQLVKRTESALKNYQELSKGFYIPKLREARIELADPVITHAETLRYLRELFPQKDYCSKDIEEFSQIFESVNSFSELVSISRVEVEEMLRVGGLDHGYTRRLEEYLTLVKKYSRSAVLVENEGIRTKNIRKEFEMKQHHTVLAAHYLALKQYYPDRPYELYAKRLQTTAKDFRIRGEDKPDQARVNKAKYASQKSIPESKEVDVLADYEHRRAVKQVTEYVEQRPKGVSDETESKYPGLRERFENFKGKQYSKWEFDEELEKAKLRWASSEQGLLDRGAGRKGPRSMQARVEEEKRMVPEIEAKYQEFCKDEREFTRQLYDKEYLMNRYIRQVMDGKNNY